MKNKILNAGIFAISLVSSFSVQAGEIRKASRYFSMCESKKAAEWGDEQPVEFTPMTTLRGLFASKAKVRECPSYIAQIDEEGGTIMPLLRFDFGKQNDSDTCTYSEDRGGMSRIGIRYTEATYKCALR